MDRFKTLSAMPFEGSELPQQKQQQEQDFRNQDQNQYEDVLTGKDLYIVQFDMDIGWYSILSNKKYVGDIPGTSFATTYEACQEHAKRANKLALAKGALVSSLDEEETSYPILGYLIFTVRFKQQPKINSIGKINREQLSELLKKSENEVDVTSYIPDWTASGNRRYVFHSNAYNKMNLTHIDLVRTTTIDDHTAFCIYNSISRLNLEYIQLLKELVSNGGGKSFVQKMENPVPLIGGDPYYQDYLKYKSLYLSNKFKQMNK